MLHLPAFGCEYPVEDVGHYGPLGKPRVNCTS
jgi:hypothetical protein